MAAPVLDATEGNSGVTLSSTPTLVRRLRVTSGNTATAITHGGPLAAPDEVRGVQISANPTQSGFAWTDSSTTTVTLDFEDDTNHTWYIFITWYNQSAGGLS